jgi:hypothetical protein
MVLAVVCRQFLRFQIRAISLCAYARSLKPPQPASGISNCIAKIEPACNSHESAACNLAKPAVNAFLRLAQELFVEISVASI